MGRVKIYGSTKFTPTDLPGGVTLERGNLIAVYAGCLGDCVPVGSPEGYSDVMWRTKTEWSYGGYFTPVFPQAGNRWNDCVAYMQDGNEDSGLDHFTNQANSNKRLLLRVDEDIPDEAAISYVRVWLSGSAQGFDFRPSYLNQYKTAAGEIFWVKPHYQIIGSAGNASSAELGFETTDLSPGPVDMDTGWGVDASNTINSKYFRLTTNSKSVAQRSLKLTSIPGQSMTGKLIKHTGWGYRFAKGARGGTPYSDDLLQITEQVGLGYFWINEIAVEVGFDLSATFAVVTVGAAPTTTTAVLYGTVNPNGDSGAVNSNFFQYGLTMNLGTNTPEIPQPSSSLHDTTATITGLTTNKLYFYRAAARTSSGTIVPGEIKTFFTGTSCSTRASLVGG